MITGHGAQSSLEVVAGYQGICLVITRFMPGWGFLLLLFVNIASATQQLNQDNIVYCIIRAQLKSSFCSWCCHTCRNKKAFYTPSNVLSTVAIHSNAHTLPMLQAPAYKRYVWSTNRSNWTLIGLQLIGMSWHLLVNKKHSICLYKQGHYTSLRCYCPFKHPVLQVPCSVLPQSVVYHNDWVQGTRPLIIDHK